MSGERTIVLWCPDWPVHAAIREAGLGEAEPVALVEHGLVFACSSTARSNGVARGLKLREAQYRSPGVILLDYDADLDARAFEPVVREVEAAVPGVEVLRPGMLAMRARGPARYYGSEDAAARALLDTVGGLGVAGATIGIADGPFAAEQAARSAGADGVRTIPPGGSAAFIAPLPLALVVEPRTATLLHRLGMRTLGEFAALPAGDVLRRFGPVGALAHSRAAGREGVGVAPRTPPPELEVLQHFEPPLERIDQLAFAFRVRAEEFVERLTSQKLVCTGLRIELADERGGFTSRGWLHPRWFTAAEVIDRVRWQLQGAGPADRGLEAPIVSIRVIPERVDGAGNHERGLWGGGPEERVHHGLTRVQSMLGHEAVVTPAIGGGRLLAERQVLVPWGDRPPEASGQQPWPGSLPALAPATVFHEAVPVELVDERGEPVAVDERGTMSAPPARFATNGRAAPVRAWAGPWPVVERWWDAERARRVHRFQLVDEAGCAWLLVRDAEGWWAEARYD